MNEKLLINGIHAGKHGALKELFDLYSKPLYILASSITGDKFMAHDIVAEAFIKFWKQRTTFHELKFIESYLTIITINVSEAYARKHSPKLYKV